jgi:type I restriction-modification system DNA methylase subunit
MPLFQKSVVTRYINSQNKEVVASQWKLYSSHFLNPKVQEDIKSLKEEQYQGEFLEDLFVKILGYTKPASSSEIQYNLTTEYKNVKDSKKADGAVIIGGKVIGVIELKGTNTTDLGKIETQAFGYKNNQPDCTYVITSNFEKLRFYIDNAVEHIEFNLFQLTEQEFKLLFLCLSYNNLSQDLARKIKEESVNQENQITKSLYKDYSIFKNDLFHNLTALNPDYEPLELFKKSQKLLDRFLFLFFAEDRQLLPPNSVRLILNQWKQLNELDEEIPLYDRYKKYFGYLNTGFKGKQHDVFAYNGGLFKPDEILDNIRIDDTLLYNHTLKLATYDFASEVDVNILGHIFENSLNELDEMKARLEGTEIDKSKTKRKKDGVFYTPKYITKYIVENTVGKLCAEKKIALEIIEEDYFTDKKRQKKTIKGLIDKLEDYRKWLLQLTICDPACGSGAFLNQALDFLIAEHKYIDELQAKLFGDAMVLTDMENSILENNLFGVDLNEESVEIAKLSLWLRTAQPNRKLNDLSSNIKCGNSLIDDSAIAGDKAFNWQNEFPKVFEKRGFDVVIGNPPYVRQELFKEFSNYFQNEYKSYSGKADLFIYFYEKSLSLVKDNGVVSFISSGKFLEASYGKPLIRLIVENSKLIEVIDFKDLNVFEGISAYPLIFSYKKTIESNDYNFNYVDATKIEVNNLNEIVENIIFENILISDFVRNDYKFIDNLSSKLISKIETNSVKLEDLSLLPLVGVKTGFNDGFKKADTKFSQDYIFGRDIKKYSSLNSETKIFFPYVFKDDKYELINETTPDLIVLDERNDLEKRAVIKEGIINGTKKWYEFQQINRKLNFENEYIVYPNVSLGNNFTLSKGNIIDMTGFIIASNSKYLLSFLNSKLVKFLMDLYAISRRGGYLEYKIQYISKLPIKEISVEKQQPFITKANTMLLLNKELQAQSEKFQRTIQRKFALIELPKKLQDWYLLNYPEFIKEIAKKKVKLTLSEEAEWEDYFITEANKVLALKTEIDTTDKAIDKMVYELYGLTSEEIEIVEGNN